MLKAYKYRMYPNKKQTETLMKHIHACRFIYNYSLEKKIKAYEQESKKLSYFDLNSMLPKIKEEFPWLKEVNSQSLQGANKNLDSAFTRFFREKARFPKFKSKKNKVQSFQVPQHYSVDFVCKKIKLPKVGCVKAVFDRRFSGRIKTSTVSVTSTGKWFISILVDDGEEERASINFCSDTTIGVDVGIKHFATFSNGEKIENPKYLYKSLQRIKVLHRRLSRKKRGSKNSRKARLKLSKKYEVVTNQRNDFLHKLSSRLVSDNQAIAVESLDVCGIIKSSFFSMGVSDASWSKFFNMLEYKCFRSGKKLIKIGRFEPSSKMCSNCGYVNRSLKVSERVWTCRECCHTHDRDINAAINIKKFALQEQNLVGIAGAERAVEPVDLPCDRKCEAGNTITNGKVNYCL